MSTDAAVVNSLLVTSSSDNETYQIFENHWECFLEIEQLDNDDARLNFIKSKL